MGGLEWPEVPPITPNKCSWQETQAQGQAGSSIKVFAGLDHLGLPANSNISLARVLLKNIWDIQA